VPYPRATQGVLPAARAPLWCIELEKWPYHTDEWNQWLSDTRAGKNPPLPAAESGIGRRRAIEEELLRNLIEQRAH
jgi:hypothetical protein